MTKAIRSQAILALIISLGSVAGLAQSTDGKDIFAQKCAMCHGPAGVPNPTMAKALGVPTVTDAAIKAMTLDQIKHQIVTGKNNMKPITGLTDAQVTAVATYFKSLSNGGK